MEVEQPSQQFGPPAWSLLLLSRRSQTFPWEWCTHSWEAWMVEMDRWWYNKAWDGGQWGGPNISPLLSMLSTIMNSNIQIMMVMLHFPSIQNTWLYYMSWASHVVNVQHWCYMCYLQGSNILIMVTSLQLWWPSWWRVRWNMCFICNTSNINSFHFA